MVGIDSLHRAVGRLIPGERIWRRDFDICCILDGCRLDTFREVWGDAGSLVSPAATSRTWLEQTFDGHDCGDVGYITGNPFAANLDETEFAYVHHDPVTETKHGIETVPPTPLTDAAIAAWRDRDRLGIDQLVVHYMQPHIPFRSRPEWFSQYRGSETWGSECWADVGDEYDREEWFAAYRDNLEWVLEAGIEPLRENADATIAMTADHGNAAGEWGVSGHPVYSPVPAVRRVPWVTVEGHDERTRTRGLPGAVSVNVEDQLQALGYSD